MTRIVLTLMLVLSSGIAPFNIALADVLLIEEVRQSDRMNLPKNGVSRDEVLASFGEPASKSASVGNPPITQWTYDGWSVYFEYELVLFTVLHKGAVLDKKSNALD
jgi:hypothetical protein